MSEHIYNSEFQAVNRRYNTTFRPGSLSLGVVVPLETYPNPDALDPQKSEEIVLDVEAVLIKGGTNKRVSTLFND